MPEEKVVHIAVTESDLKELEELYAHSAVDIPFEWRGQRVLPAYAKYLIEYLKGRFPNA